MPKAKKGESLRGINALRIRELSEVTPRDATELKV